MGEGREGRTPAKIGRLECSLIAILREVAAMEPHGVGGGDAVSRWEWNLTPWWEKCVCVCERDRESNLRW